MMSVNGIGLRSLLDLDIHKSSTLWKHSSVEEFLDRAWAKGPPAEKHVDDLLIQGRRKHRVHKTIRYIKSCVYHPRLILNYLGLISRLLWASHVFYNIVFLVLLTAFVYSPTLLNKYPHPLGIAIMKAFIIPSLFPPYTSAFL